jgi:hypothetical protein
LSRFPPVIEKILQTFVHVRQILATLRASFFSGVIYGYLKHWGHLPTHILGTACTLLLPVLLPVLDRRVRQRRKSRVL